MNSRLISVRYVAGSPCESTGFHHVLDLPWLIRLTLIPSLLPKAFSSAAAFML